MIDLEVTPPSSVESARAADLRYVTDDKPGLQRRRRGKTFTYVDAAGQPVKDKAVLARIKHLVIPPAWENVWIAPQENAHLQVTGKDARGRKQYRYHTEWRAARDGNKYTRVLAFGKALPAIRARVEQDLALPGLPKPKVLAAVVKLLEATLIRVGNEEYARTNKSYGLTTMLDRHATVHGSTITFKFKGKSGVNHNINVTDPKLAKIVRKCQDLPGQEIFAYVDEAGDWVDIKSQDVNEYIHEIAGDQFTAKDFRTWSGTVLAAIALQEFQAYTTAKEAKTNIVRAVESVAKLLGNTPSICRKCYVHPEVLESYLEGATISTIRQIGGDTLAKEIGSLKPEEAAVMALLQERLARTATTKPAVKKSLQKVLAKSLREVKKSRRKPGTQ